RLSERSQMDAAVLYAEHNDLMTIEPAASYLVAGPPAYTALPRVFFNKASATTRGLEWNGSWRPTDKWQFKAAYTWLKMDIHRNADSGDTSIESEVGRSPQNQFQLQVFHSPTAKIDLSASLYYVDSLPSLNIPAYTRMDARVGWRVQRDLELSLTGRNLFDPSHPEFINSSGPRTTEIPRSVFGAATWRF
ncbi:MAG: TonB-dependent receptor, partial [Sulfuricella sp.]